MNEYNELVRTFVNLPTDAKAKEIIKHLKEQIVMYQSLCKQYGYNDELMLNREMLDVEKENASIDDYYEAIFAYVKTLENIAGKFLNSYLENK